MLTTIIKLLFFSIFDNFIGLFTLVDCEIRQARFGSPAQRTLTLNTNRVYTYAVKFVKKKAGYISKLVRNCLEMLMKSASC